LTSAMSSWRCVQIIVARMMFFYFRWAHRHSLQKLLEHVLHHFIGQSPQIRALHSSHFDMMRLSYEQFLQHPTPLPIHPLHDLHFTSLRVLNGSLQKSQIIQRESAIVVCSGMNVFIFTVRACPVFILLCAFAVRDILGLTTSAPSVLFISFVSLPGASTSVSLVFPCARCPLSFV